MYKYMWTYIHMYMQHGFKAYLFRYRSYVAQDSSKLDTNSLQASKFQIRMHFTKGLMCLPESLLLLTLHNSVKV